jgi:hypothetical protein
MHRVGYTTDMRHQSRASLIAVLAALGAASLACAKDADDIGIIQRSQGGVQIERNGSRAPATRGETLLRGDRIVTDAGGSAEVRIRGAAPIRVGPNANVAVERFAANDPGRTGDISPLFHGLSSLFTGFSRHR